MIRPEQVVAALKSKKAGMVIFTFAVGCCIVPRNKRAHGAKCSLDLLAKN